jgi:hypothetical protein
MRAVKRHCAELRNHCERVNADMQASKYGLNEGS